MSREMKNSGVPWLKDIPSNWNVERGKNVLVLQKRPVRESDDVVTCFRDGEVILRSLRRTEGFTMSDKEIGYQGINEGDIVIHGMDGFAGAMGVSKSTGKGSPVLVVCSPKYDAIPQYIIYYLRALAMTDVFIALATGIRERSCDLRWNKISELEFILPSSIEQQKIASFLDRKCAEIDEMIALQEKIVEELKAYKQSVITEAVTKGLNPDAQMKDSGVYWIGLTPKVWELAQLKRFCYVNSGREIEHEVKQTDENAFPVYGSGGVFKYTDKPLFSGETILFGRKGTLGKPIYANAAIWVVDTMYFLTFKKGLLAKYSYYLLSAFDWEPYITHTAIPSIVATEITACTFPIPPIQQQQIIAESLDKKCAEIDTLISLKQSKIEALKEYKKSIIYEFVTGKKEVPYGE